MLLALSFVVNTIAGLTFAGVGVTLLALRPPRAGATALAIFALVSGLQQVLGNVGSAISGASVLAVASFPFLAVTPLALLAGITRYVGVRAPAWIAPFAIVTAAGAILLLASPTTMIDDPALADMGQFLWIMPLFAALAASVHLLARAHRDTRSSDIRHEVRLLLLALMPYLAYTTSFLLVHLGFVAPRDYSPRVDAGFVTLSIACLAMAGWATRSLWGSGERPARILCAFTIGVGATGALQALVFTEWALFGGVLRILAALFLGYGLLKYGLFGIDLKIKWTLDRGMLLGIFGGVFFLVDQAAQFFVSDAYGALAGLIAALLMVFALAPLRKLTHRLADRAMPRTSDTPEYLAERRIAIYRAAAHTALRDGTITADERSMLDALVEGLGLTSAEAGSIEREAQVAARHA